MGLIATLISHPSERQLDPECIRKVTEILSVTHLKWLEESIACDLEIPNTEHIPEKQATLEALLAHKRIDIIIQEESKRRKKILIADMDSTIINQECIDELAERIGKGKQVKDITQHAMNGEISFENALKERAALLEGADAKIIQDILDKTITLTSGARKLIATMRAHGAWTALISGGFQAFTQDIAQKAGFHENHANQLSIENGRLTGKLVPPILGPNEKAFLLEKIAHQHAEHTDDVIAVGDGANDIPMLQKAGTGIAFHAKPAVIQQTQFKINYGDLTALLFLQGYRKNEFVKEI